MPTHVFFWINIVIAGLFIFWFARARRSVVLKPTRLNLKYNPRNNFVTIKNANNNSDQNIHFSSQHSTSEVKNLNVIFMYNGHCWDAFEVLGLPAGSSVAAVRSALDRAMAAAQPQSHEFLQAAAEAIQRDRQVS